VNLYHPTPPHLGQLPKVHVYIDETGDRGFSERSIAKAPFFAMSSLLVPEEEEWQVKVTAGGLRALIHSGRPQDVHKPLHWVDHFKAKHPERRERAARMLAQLPSAQVIHVIADKRTMSQDTGLRNDRAAFYNFTTRYTLERVALAARHWPGGPRLAIVHLAAVKHMDHAESADYLSRVRGGLTASEGWGVPWDYIKWPPTWHATNRDGVQLADIHAGLLHCALSGSPDSAECAQNLLICKHQLRRSPGGTVLGYGVKVIGSPQFVTSRVWYRDWVTKP